MTSLRVFAPAKVNLTLHITGQRADGYHLIDSLVTFAGWGDEISLSPAAILSLTVEGPEASGVPADMDNLALRAADLVAGGRGAALTLAKELPVASGLGGGSADAAAAFKGMLALPVDGRSSADDLLEAPDEALKLHAAALLELGADIPMCVLSAPARVRGIGEDITPLPLPHMPAVLVNPRVPVSTPAVFAALASKTNAAMPDIPEFRDAETFAGWLSEQRNDLEEPARAMVPQIGEALAALADQPGCRLARMSGSGATCFGLFPDRQAAEGAGKAIAADHRDWWVCATPLGDQSANVWPVSS